mmetsp:Transcript_2979/g.4517  ORF Transcript_2979/g.4517 Transcript_2979/m.4517 type:complete len:604 (-) Transcript_2979:156-1967(-)|eukprot:CAMPEP_0185031760 /NCGR_PEP_ID=MMETSP1103-20130426/19387_1 /TAXON_ID=36769 /ORGANISM="Paraphysomonas bandaiensis, Strain Caron Lab Isolate" /LENGTH=603 /DNA_ID=CAMNT_0027567395 /DNA_START=66 /DNA_END=1877 /DNA_ORIENTATION=-
MKRVTPKRIVSKSDSKGRDRTGTARHQKDKDSVVASDRSKDKEVRLCDLSPTDKNKVARLVEQVIELGKENDQLRDRVSELEDGEDDRQKLLAEQLESRHKIDDLSKTSSQLEAEKVKLLSMLHMYQQKMQDLANELKISRRLLTEEQLKSTDLKSEIVRLESLVGSQKSLIDTTKERYESTSTGLLDELKKCRLEVMEKTEECSKYQHKYQQLEANTSYLASQLDELLPQLNAKNSRIRALEEAVKAAEEAMVVPREPLTSTHAMSPEQDNPDHQSSVEHKDRDSEGELWNFDLTKPLPPTPPGHLMLSSISRHLNENGRHCQYAQDTDVLWERAAMNDSNANGTSDVNHYRNDQHGPTVMSNPPDAQETQTCGSPVFGEVHLQDIEQPKTCGSPTSLQAQEEHTIDTFVTQGTQSSVPPVTRNVLTGPSIEREAQTVKSNSEMEEGSWDTQGVTVSRSVQTTPGAFHKHVPTHIHNAGSSQHRQQQKGKVQSRSQRVKPLKERPISNSTRPTVRNRAPVSSTRSMEPEQPRFPTASSVSSPGMRVWTEISRDYDADSLYGARLFDLVDELEDSHSVRGFLRDDTDSGSLRLSLTDSLSRLE